MIKSNDEQTPDVTLSPYRITIVIDETSAGKISTKSPMTLEGFIRIGVLDKPAAQQPAYVDEVSLLDTPSYVTANGLSGLLAVGRFNVNTGYSGSRGPLLLMRNNAVIKIDGVARKFYEAPARGRAGGR